ncbi:MAG: hypothetical protein ACRYF3_07015 [Janthinobacterium lividum]
MPAVIGGEDSAVAAGDDLGAFGLNAQAQQPARMLGVGVGVEALNGEQVQVLQSQQLIGDGAWPGVVGEGGWAAGGVRGATVRWSVAGQYSWGRSAAGLAAGTVGPDRLGVTCCRC